MGRVTAEIEIMKTLRHPHLVQLFEVLRDDKYIYLIMEFMEVLFSLVLSFRHFTDQSPSLVGPSYHAIFIRADPSCHITVPRTDSAAMCLALSWGMRGEKCPKSGLVANSRKFLAALIRGFVWISLVFPA
jgi:hypothetical protein